jgi:hypothetical protein
MRVDLEQSFYALDSTTIDLCLSLFPSARFLRHKGAVKMHTWMEVMAGTTEEDAEKMRDFLLNFDRLPLTAEVAERADQIAGIAGSSCPMPSFRRPRRAPAESSPPATPATSRKELRASTFPTHF